MHVLPVLVASALLLGCSSKPREVDPRPGAPVDRLPAAPPADAQLADSAALPFIAQTEPNDCAPAALAITLNHHRHPTTLDEAKAAMHYQSKAMSAFDLVQAAEARGLGVVGVALDAATAPAVLRTGDILHVDFDHFVVFEALAEDGVRVMDPGHGRKLLDRATFASRFTGVALLFERTPEALELRKRSIGLPPAR